MELSAKEKALVDEALQREITARLAAEEQALRAVRRAEAEAAAAAAAATKLAALALAKDSMIHTSVQQVIPSQDVQVCAPLHMPGCSPALPLQHTQCTVHTRYSGHAWCHCCAHTSLRSLRCRTGCHGFMFVAGLLWYDYLSEAFRTADRCDCLLFHGAARIQITLMLLTSLSGEEVGCDVKTDERRSHCAYGIYGRRIHRHLKGGAGQESRCRWM